LKEEKMGKTVKFSLFWLVAMVASVFVACESSSGETSRFPRGGDGGITYDTKTPYPISIEAKLAQFVTEGADSTLQIVDFDDEDTAPVPTTNPHRQKEANW
jgi:hypothetical protein